MISFSSDSLCFCEPVSRGAILVGSQLKCWRAQSGSLANAASDVRPTEELASRVPTDTRVVHLHGGLNNVSLSGAHLLLPKTHEVFYLHLGICVCLFVWVCLVESNIDTMCMSGVCVEMIFCFAFLLMCSFKIIFNRKVCFKFAFLFVRFPFQIYL